MNETELTMLARVTELQRNLEWYAGKETAEENKLLDLAKKDLAKYLDRLPDPQKSRLPVLLANVENFLTETTDNLIVRIALVAGSVSAATSGIYSDILSWDGEARAIQPIELAQEEMVRHWRQTPVGGRLLSDWVQGAFTHEMKNRISDEARRGVLDGLNHDVIVKRLYDALEATKSQLETLVKTYVHSASSDAMERLYARNDIDKVRWVATFEGGRGNGRGTCLRCAALDGKIFDRDKAPSSPLHPRCRCVKVPVTDMKKLDLSQEGKEAVMRPYTVWENGRVTRGRQEILKAGRYKGTLAEWAMEQPEHVLNNMVGVKRAEMLRQGTIKFEDLVTQRTFRIKRLDELPAAA